MKIYLVAGWEDYMSWIPNAVRTLDLKEADLVLFEGGEDVTPALYGEKAHPNTYNSIERDTKEIVIYKQAIELGKKILGVCRGSQLTCVMAGGKLVQHQNNPGTHLMKTADFLNIKVSSTHHQAQYPFNLPTDNYQILGWTEDMLKFHEDGNQNELSLPVECEVVYYPKINALGIQPHPEMLWDTRNNKPKEGFEDSIKWFQSILEEFIKN